MLILEHWFILHAPTIFTILLSETKQLTKVGGVSVKDNVGKLMHRYLYFLLSSSLKEPYKACKIYAKRVQQTGKTLFKWRFLVQRSTLFSGGKSVQSLCSHKLSISATLFTVIWSWMLGYLGLGLPFIQGDDQQTDGWNEHHGEDGEIGF